MVAEPEGAEIVGVAVVESVGGDPTSLASLEGGERDGGIEIGGRGVFLHGLLHAAFGGDTAPFRANDVILLC